MSAPSSGTPQPEMLGQGLDDDTSALEVSPRERTTVGCVGTAEGAKEWCAMGREVVCYGMGSGKP